MKKAAVSGSDLKNWELDVTVSKCGWNKPEMKQSLHLIVMETEELGQCDRDGGNLLCRYKCVFPNKT